MNFDLKTALATIAPTLATMLAGPLAGTAVSAIAAAFGLAPGATAADIGTAIQEGKMTPEVIAAMRMADQQHEQVMGQQGIDLAKINADHQAATDTLVIDDVKSARESNASHDSTWRIAYLVLGTFVFIMTVVLWGCWRILEGGITIADVSTVAAISGLVGAIVGYVAANAQTVINFIFGGSLGSRRTSAALSDSVTQALSSVTK